MCMGQSLLTLGSRPLVLCRCRVWPEASHGCRPLRVRRGVYACVSVYMCVLLLE